MRVISTLLLAVISVTCFAQQVFISMPTGGNWNASGTWSFDGATPITCDPCVAGTDYPGASDIAVVAVDPGSSVTVNVNAAVGDLYVVSDVAGSISKIGFGFRTLTINGQLSGANPDLSGALQPPSVNVFQSSANSLILSFTGSSALGPVITEWGHNSPIYRVALNPGVGNLNTDSFTFVDALTSQSGTVQLNSGHEIRSTTTGSRNASISAGAILNLQGPINGGSSSTGINSFVVNGTLTTGIAGYLNASSVTLSAGSIFNSGFAGNEGWWHDDFAEPNDVLNPTSTVNYSANANQNVYATTYGNVNFGGTGTKTIVGTGDFIVSGNISVVTSPVTLTSVNTNEKSAAGNVTVNGTWSIPSSFSLNGTGPQTIGGSGTVNFAGGLQIANTDDVVSLAKDINVTGGLTLNAGSTLNLASRTLTLNGGTLTYDGAITANTGGAGGTLVSTGTTAVTGTATSKVLNNLTVTGGIFTAPTAGLVLTGNLNVTAGSFVAPGGTLELAGNLSTVDNTNFDANSGTIDFNGTQDQTISGTVTVRNVNITNTGATNGVLVSGALNLGGILTLSPSTKFDADGPSNAGVTTLLSSADEPTIDGAIAALPGLASFSGNVTVQRYMSVEGTNGRMYRFISSPVSGASVAQIQSEIPVTGTFTGASTCTGCLTNPSMFTYNEAVTGDTDGSGGNTLDDGYVPFPVSTNSETLTKGKGYTLFVRGNLSGSAKWDVTGPIHRGFTDYSPTYTSTGVPANDGWNLIGNPYPSTIDWEAASGWTRNANVGSTIYMRDQATGSISTYVLGGSSTNDGSRYIAMGQAYWVQAVGGSPQLQSNEAVKVGGTQTIFIRDGEPMNALRISLGNEEEDLKDETLVQFRQDATEGFDLHADAWKWKNDGVFNLSILTKTGEDLAINAIPDISCGTGIKLKVEDVEPGDYTLEFSGFNSFDSPVKVKLTDKFTNKTRVLSADDVYNFSVTTDAASKGEGRFEMTFLNSKPFVELQAVAESLGESCGAGSVELIASGAPGDGEYNWYESETDNNPIESQHGTNFITPELQKSQTYYVAAVDSKGCTGPKVAVQANVIAFDPITISEEISGTLEANYTENIQWYFNDEPIDGATDPVLHPNQNGKYRVESVIEEGCVTSVEYDFLITDIREQQLSSRFSVYPNPSDRILNFSAPASERVFDVTLVNNVGAAVGKMQLDTRGGVTSGELNLEHVAAGFYVLRVYGESSGLVSIKIVRK